MLVIIHLSQVGTMRVIRYGLSCELLQLLVCRIRNPELHKEARQNYHRWHAGVRSGGEYEGICKIEGMS